MQSLDMFFEQFFSQAFSQSTSLATSKGSSISKGSSWEKGLCIFPNSQSRHFWTSYLAKKHQCISLKNFLTLNQFQQRLQAKTLQQENTSFRFLTPQETDIMLAKLLQNPQVQSYVLEIERLESISNKKIVCDTLYKTYAHKLLQILQQHILYETFESPLTEKIQGILLLYAKLLSDHTCIDSIVLSHIMKRNMLSQSTHNPFHLFIINANLFHPQDLLWIQHFGEAMTMHAQAESIKNKFFTYEEIITDTPPPNTHPPAFPEQLDYQAKKSPEPSLHVYQNSALEFENIFSSIHFLLLRGVAPHDISLMVCQYDSTIESEFLSLAKKYQIPFNIVQSQKNVVLLFLSLLQEIYNTHFNPEVLKRLFFEPCFQWKRRDMHTSIVSKGLENSCVNDKNLSQWKYILHKHTEELKYFNLFVKIVRNIIKAKNFEDLYSHLEMFGTCFFAHKTRALGTYDINEQQLINIILMECEKLFSFEQYLYNQNNQTEKKSSYNKLNPWDILVNNFDNNSTINNRYSSIQVSRFPHALGTNYQYQFICNISQKAIIQTTCFTSIFNDYLSQSYNAKEITHAYTHYKHSLLDYINTHASALYLSASIEGNDGAHILPIYWDTQEVNTIYDTWKIETDLWNTQKLSDDFYISDSQKRGLLYFNELEFETNNSQSSLTKRGISEELYLATYPQGQSISINASSSLSLFTPELFYMSDILKLTPFLPEKNTSMNESLVWGSVYHNMTEQLLKEHLQYPSNDPDKKSQPDLFHGLFYHSYIKETIEYAFQNLNLNQHITYLSSILPKLDSSEQSHIKIEEVLESDIRTVIQTITQNQAYAHFLDDINDEILSYINIRGRADLLYKKLEEPIYHIIDFKRANSEYNFTGVFQLWLYFIISNHDMFSQESSFSLLDKNHNSYAHLYFIAEDTDTQHCMYPTATKMKKQDAEIIHNIPTGLLTSLSLLSQLYKGIDTIRKETDSLHNPTIDAFRDTGLPLHIKNILREGCYIYVK